MRTELQNGKKLWSEPSVTEVLVSMTNAPPQHPPGKSCYISVDALDSSGKSNCES